MSTKVEQAKEQEITQYSVQYPISAYTFPADARIHQVRIDDEYIHIELTR